MKNLSEWLKSSVDEAEERLNELEGKSIEMIKSEEQKEKRVKINEKRLRDLL